MGPYVGLKRQYNLVTLGVGEAGSYCRCIGIFVAVKGRIGCHHTGEVGLQVV
jgi:hypothetical protein